MANTHHIIVKVADIARYGLSENPHTVGNARTHKMWYTLTILSVKVGN